MYILTIPSFTWLKVDQSNQPDLPAPRAGHSCAMRDAQLLVVGGFLGDDSPCDDPGFHVFDASALKWKTSFRAADHAPDWHPDNLVLAGSYGYSVPEAVREVVGGGGHGGATASTPAVGPATDGPFATGKAPVYTVTQPAATATMTTSSDPTDSDHSSSPDDSRPGLVAAGVVAGIAGLLALYLGFCAWLYRRQVRAYKAHLAVANRYSGESPGVVSVAQQGRQPSRWSSRESFFGWVGSEREPSGGSSEREGIDGSSGGGSASRRKQQSEGSRMGMGGGVDGGSTERLLEGQEPSFFSVVVGPRRALRVVNGVE